MRLFIVDAFTETAFGGNPAGVVLLEHEAAAGWMQDVAAELKHSETAFVRRRDDGAYDLRWFTPSVEVDLCGHATLATAHALARSGAAGPFTFHTRSGRLSASVTGDEITLDFPAQPPAPVPAPPQLAQALGVRPHEVLGNGIDVMAVLGDAAEVADLEPDFALLGAIDARGVIVTAAAAPGADHDFVSRFFAVLVGVDEDPVTGSAHCALAPYWAQRLDRPVLTGYQLSARGGRVGVEVRADRVLLTGRAVTVIEGQLLA